LAVNTAGMLVRRDAVEALGGFDPHLPLYGNDIDFGWRAARAGLRTIIVPSAVVFHAEAAHRGVRRSSLSGRRTRTHRYEREAAILGLWAARVAFGPIAGGALSPAPAHAADWWRLALEGWHQLGQGTDAPAPGYVLPFALAASTIGLGSPTVVVSLLFLVAV